MAHGSLETAGSLRPVMAFHSFSFFVSTQREQCHRCIFHHRSSPIIIIIMGVVAPVRPRPQVDTRKKLLNHLGFIQRPPSIPSFHAPTTKLTPTTCSSSFASSDSYSYGCCPASSVEATAEFLPEDTPTPTTARSSIWLLGDPVQTFQLPLNDLRLPPRVDGQEGQSPFHLFLLFTAAVCRATSSPTSSLSSSFTEEEHPDHKEEPSTDVTNTPPPLPPRRTVRFQETVHAASIPSRYQYSDRIKQCLWTNRMELRELSRRNYIEFEYENFDWNQVVLEEQMYLDSVTGTFIHPCHFATTS